MQLKEKMTRKDISHNSLDRVNVLMHSKWNLFSKQWVLTNDYWNGRTSWRKMSLLTAHTLIAHPIVTHPNFPVRQLPTFLLLNCPPCQLLTHLLLTLTFAHLFVVAKWQLLTANTDKYSHNTDNYPPDNCPPDNCPQTITHPISAYPKHKNTELTRWV